MSTSHRSKRFAALHHLVSGGVLALKGFDKLEQRYFYVGAALFALGVLLLAYFTFERFAQNSSRHLSVLGHACEGVAFLFLTYLYFVEGRLFLPWATLAAATGLLIAALAHARPSKASFQHLLRVADSAEAGAFFVDVWDFGASSRIPKIGLFAARRSNYGSKRRNPAAVTSPNANRPQRAGRILDDLVRSPGHHTSGASACRSSGFVAPAPDTCFLYIAI